MTKLEGAKGVRDFPPEKKIPRDLVVQTLKNTFELYGFSPLETPAIERFDVLASKYAGGAEILKETFKFKDQGDRELCLRYDLTVPLCRFVGMNPNLKMPFKRYQIGSVFRDGPIKLGRYREFWQCDVDIIGSKKMMSDAQILILADFALKKLGLDFVIKVNNRKLLNGIMEYSRVPDDKIEEVIMSIDKLEKIGEADVRKELASKGLKDCDKLFKILSLKTIDEMKKILDNKSSVEGIGEIEEIFNYLKKLSIKSVVFSPKLARGLSYYTGTVFEGFLNDSKIKSSICGGGRYDNMIGQFLGGKQEFPAVGISFGLDVITDSLSVENKKTVTEIFVIPIGTEIESMKITEELRRGGINSDIDLNNRGPSKNINYADSLKIPFVVFVGEDELRGEKLKFRDMKTGKEEMLTVKEIIKKVKNDNC